MDTEIQVKKLALVLEIENLRNLENGTGRLDVPLNGTMNYSMGNISDCISEIYKSLSSFEKTMIDVVSKTELAIKFALKKFCDADNTGAFKDIGASLGSNYSDSTGIKIGDVYINSNGDAAKDIFIDTPVFGQNTSFTCGSASGRMILGSLGIQVSESEFWNYANAGGCGTYVYRVTQTLNHFIGSDVYRYVDTTKMSLDEYAKLLTDSLEKGYPVEVVASIPSGTEFGYRTPGHYFVVSGVYRDANGELMARINDPFSGSWYSNGHQGQQFTMKLSDVKQYNANHSGYVICG